MISSPLEISHIEREVAQAIEQLRGRVKTMRGNLEGYRSDETNLLAKIEKKKLELDRAEKRLKSLNTVRPAYMDEYERVEAELIGVYEQYTERFRNVAFLEQQLDELNREEQGRYEETESNLKRMQNQMREDELEILRDEKNGESRIRKSRPSGLV